MDPIGSLGTITVQLSVWILDNQTFVHSVGKLAQPERKRHLSISSAEWTGWNRREWQVRSGQNTPCRTKNNSLCVRRKKTNRWQKHVCVARHGTSRHCQCVWVSFEEIPVWDPLVRERASGWREIDENMCQMSRRQLIFEGVFLWKAAGDVTTYSLTQMSAFADGMLMLWNALSGAQIPLLAVENVPCWWSKVSYMANFWNVKKSDNKTQTHPEIYEYYSHTAKANISH